MTNHTDNAALLPCPFCGSNPALQTDGEQGYWIECANAACGSSTNMRIALMDDVQSLLTEQWNRRASPAPAEAPELTTAQINGGFEAWVKEDRIPPIQRQHHYKTWCRAIAVAGAKPAPVVEYEKLGPIDANRLEKLAKERPNECFIKGSGVLKLLGAIRQLEREAREAAQPAPMPVARQTRIEQDWNKVMDELGCDDADVAIAKIAALKAGQQVAAVSPDVLKDAERYRRVRSLVGAMAPFCRQVFHLEYLKPIEGANLFKGSVAQHFDEAVDAAIQSTKGEGNV